jgi:hypothetical protein
MVMLGDGWAFDQLEGLSPAIKVEYDNKSIFRDWPGWTKCYMRAHPCWFGFVFAFVYVLVSQSRLPAVAVQPPGTGHCTEPWYSWWGVPVFALVYASFQVSLELLALLWAVWNLAQYVLAGVFLGLVVQACRTSCCTWPRRIRRLLGWVVVARRGR